MDGKNLSIAALVCGILGLVGGWFPIVCYFTFVLAIVGIVLGAIGMKKSKAANGKASGLAIAGLVCGIIGTVIGLIGLICVVCVASAAGAIVNAAVQSGEINQAELDAALNSLASALQQ